ncbi:MAG: Panacea domain-containing protein [Patescibacteria group bacterium]
MLELEKIKQATLYLSSSMEQLYFTKYLKLVYYLDFLSVLETGKPVTNDTYYRLSLGPVPTFIKDQMNLLRVDCKTQEKELFSSKDDNLFMSIFDGTISFTSDRIGFLITPVINVDVNFNCLSDYEKKLLEDIVEEFKEKTAKDIVDQTHQEAPYLQTSPNDVIDYKLAFYLDRNKILPKRTYPLNIEVSQMEYSERM